MSRETAKSVLPSATTAAPRPGAGQVGLVLAQMLHECDLPRGTFGLVHGDTELLDHLAQLRIEARAGEVMSQTLKRVKEQLGIAG